MKKGGKGKASRKKQENKGGDWNPGPQPHPPTTGGNIQNSRVNIQVHELRPCNQCNYKGTQDELATHKFTEHQLKPCDQCEYRGTKTEVFYHKDQYHRRFY